MQKHLQKLLLLAAMLLVPWVTQGQGFSYSCNFDGVSDTAGWVFVNGSQVNKWVIGTATHNSGTKSLYISNDNGTSNSYTNSSITFVYAYQEFTLDAGGYAISYDWKANGEGNYDYIRVFLAPSSLSLTAGQDPSGGTSAYNWRNAAFPTGCIGLCGADKLNQQTSWQNFVTEFTVPTAGTYRLVFAWANDGSGGSTPPGAIDNIVLLQPTCPRPDNMHFANITPTSFDFSWSETGTAATWIVEIDSAGTNLVSEMVYDTNYSATGLTGNSTYTVRVAALCDGTDTSMWLVSSFHTPCSFIDSLPYQNDFENDPYYSAVAYAQAFPTCWTRINDATGTYNYYPYITTTASYVHSGSKGMYWYFTTTSGYAQNEYAVLPGIDTTVYNISDLTLAFYAKTTSSSYHPAPIVGVMTNPNDASTFTPVYTFSNTAITTEWVMYEVPFANYTGYGNFIAIKCPRPSSTAYMAIDDIFLTDDWCNIPLDVVASPSTEEVTISWNPNGGTSFTVILGTDTINNVVDTTYTFTMLSPNTQYNYAVATECATSNSAYIAGSVRTQCVALDSLPFVETFESAPTGSSTTGTAFVNCWNHLNNGSSYGGYPYVGSSTSYNHTPGGSKGLYWYNTTTTGTYGDYECVVLPSVDTDLFAVNTLQLRFWAKSNSGSPVLYVGVMSNPSDINSFQPVDTLNISSTWTEFTSVFNNFEGYGNCVAVKSVRASWTAYVDDFTLEPIPTCPRPNDLTVSGTDPDSIAVEWDEVGEATEWFVVAVEQGGNPDTCTTGVAVYDENALLQLISGLAYDIYVRSICGGSDSSTWTGPVTVIPGLYLMGASGSDTLRTCRAVICDDGGPNGTYGMSEDFTLYVLPGSADSILSISGSSYTESSFDYIRIYDGIGTSGTQVWNDYGVSSHQTFGPFTSLEGAFTIVWHSDGSVVYDGFQINVRCLGQPDCPAPADFNLAYSSVDTVRVVWRDTANTGNFQLCYGPTGMDPDTVEDNLIIVTDTTYDFTTLSPTVDYDIYVRADCGAEQSWWIGPLTVRPGSYNMPVTGHDTITACAITIYDDGGSLGQYSNNANSTLVLRAPHPDSLFVFSGTAYTESTLDQLTIYDGVGTSGTILWQTSSSTVNESIPLTTSNSGVVTLSWHTDGSVTYSGFEISFTCQSAPECNSVTEVNISHVAGSSALLSWSLGSGNTGGDPVYYNVTVNGVTDTTSQNPYWLTGLTPGTHYYVNVQGVCASTGTSFMVSNDFTTTCLSGGDLEISGGTGSNVYYPLNAQVNYSYTQEIYNASQLNGPMTVTGISYRTQSNGCSNRNISVYLAETSQNVFHTVSDFIPDSLLHLVYTGTFGGAASTWIPIYFDSSFSYSGMGNLVVALYDHTGSTGTANFQTRSGGSDTTALHFHNSTAINLASPSGSTQRATTVQNDIRFISACDTTATCVAPNVAVFNTEPYSAFISWAPGRYETSWDVAHKADADATWTVDAVGYGSTTYTVTGLNPNTRYTFRVTANCTDTTIDGFDIARTGCAYIDSLPFTENFETATTSSSTTGSAFVNCWQRLNNGTSYGGYPYVSSSSSYNHTSGGSKGLYWYNSTTTGSYGDYQCVVLPGVDTTIYPINTLQLAFWAKPSSSSYTPIFQIGVMSDPNDVLTFRGVDTITLTSTDWTEIEVPLNNYTGNGCYPAVKAVRPSSSWYAYVDDFRLELTPTCPRPNNLLITGNTANSISLDWTERGSATEWEVAVETSASATPTADTNVNSHPITFGGLTAGTNYYVYVRSICGPGDTSLWSDVINAVPGSWNMRANMTDTLRMCGGAIYDEGGPNGSYYTSNQESYIILYPDAPNNLVSISGTSYTEGSFDYLRIYDGVGNSGTELWNDYGVSSLQSFGPLTSESGPLTIYFYTDGSVYYDGFAINVSCVSAFCRVLNMHLDPSVPQSDSRLAITWDTNGSLYNEVEYGPHGFTQGTGTMLTTYTNSIVITGLTSLTNYDVYVRSICSATDTGSWTRGTFQTAMCDDVTIAENWTGTSSSSTTEYGPIGYSCYNYSYSQMIIDSADLASLDGDITAFGFKPYNSASSYGGYFTGIDIYMANISESTFSNDVYRPDSNHQFVQVLSNANLNFSNDNWQLISLDTAFTWDGHSNILFVANRRHGVYSCSAEFEGHSTTGYKSAVIYNDDSAFNHISSLSMATTDAYTDFDNTVSNIRFYSCGTVGCRQPVVTSVTKDYHSATVTWTGEGSNYEVNIKPTTATDWPATDITVSGNTYTFNGLQPATNYTFRVRQDCTADSLGYSEWVIGTVLTDSLPCLAPDSLNVTAVTNATATFDWNINGNENVWDIHVWSGTYDSIYRVILRPSTVGGFTAGLTYNAAIRPVCGVNLLEGDWSDTIQFSTAICPDVTGLTASNVSTNSVTLNWTANPMAQSWIIEYGPLGFTQGSGIMVTCNTNTYVVTGLLDGMTYDFHVKAVCGNDWNSENWSNVSATTQTGEIPCDPPTGVSATVADNSVTINWSAGTGNISFEIEYGNHGFAHGSGITTSATSSPAVIHNLDYETQYDVYVRAICDQNTYSDWGAMATFTTGQRPSEDCDPVQNLSVTNVTETSASVTWQPGTSGDNWQVVLTDASGATVSDNVTSETSANFSGLSLCTNYTVKVRTVCDDDNYSAYTTANFKTLGCEGIGDVEGISCSIFPNPANSSTTVSVSGVNGKVRISVVDMNGRTVATETLECSDDCVKTMDIDNLAQGAYFVRITADNVNMVKKLIVR